MEDSSSKTTKQLSEFLDQLKVLDKTVSLREFKNRQVALDKARNLLSNLSEEGFIVEEGFLEIISPEGEKLGDYIREIPDFIIHKEDIKFSVFIDIEKDKYLIDRDKWKKISANFDEKAITSIILSWAKKDLKSCALDSFSIRKYAEVSDKEINFKGESFSLLSECIKEFYNMQFIEWEIPEKMEQLVTHEIQISLQEMLSKYFQSYFSQLKKVKFIIPEKIQAQSLIKEHEFKKILDFFFELLSKEELEIADNRKIDNFIKKIAE